MRRVVGGVAVAGLVAGLAVVAGAPAASASVTANTSGTIVNVLLSGAETVGFSCNGSGQVRVGSVVPQPALACSAVTRVNISGDDGAQVILGGGLDAPEFSANPYIVASMGGGNDRMSETDRADNFDMGAGDDTIFLEAGGLANVGNDLGAGALDWAYFDGTDDPDTMTATSANSQVSVTVTSTEGGSTRSAVNAERLGLRSQGGKDTISSVGVGGGSTISYVFHVGGEGNDTITAGPRASSAYGEEGSNALNAGTGSTELVSDSPTDSVNTGASGADSLEDRVSGRSGGRTITGSTLARYLQRQGGCDAQARIRPAGAGTVRVTSSLCRFGSQDLPATVDEVAIDFGDAIANRAVADVVLGGSEDYVIDGDDQLDDIIDITVPSGTFTVSGNADLRTITTSSAALGDVEVRDSANVFVHGAWTNTYERFGHKAIRDLLFRLSTQGERITIRNALATSAKTRPQIVAELMGTDEYRGLDVDRVFVRFLKRASDPGGRTYWINALRGGRPLRTFRAQLFGSPEYYSKAGGTPAGFVRAAYFDVMGRLPDPSGQAYWTNKVAGGADRGQVANTFLASTEARRTIVQDQHLRFLRRLPTAQEAEQWVATLAGPTGEQQLIATLAAGDDYYLAD